MRAENQRCISPRAASTRASSATTSASAVTRPAFPLEMPSSTIFLNSSGEAITRNAETTTSARKAVMCSLYGFANRRMRFSVPLASF